MKDQDIKNKFLIELEQLVIFNDFEKDLLMKYISPFFEKRGKYINLKETSRNT